MPLGQAITLLPQTEELTLSFRIVNNQTTLKPTPGRVNYFLSNYCAPCELKLSKEYLRCPECKHKVRTKAWRRSKVIKNHKKI